MTRRDSLRTLLVSLTSLGACMGTQPQPPPSDRIAAGDIEARFDAAGGTLSLRRGGREFASGRFTEAGHGAAAVEKTGAGSPWGPGWMMKIGPGENRVAVREGSPFVFLRRDPRSAPPSEGNRVEVTRLALAGEASKYRALGPGGLFDLAANPGQHVLSAVADPSTRAGVVAGLVRIDAASGVLFTAADAGKAVLILRADYGRVVPPDLDPEGGDWWALGSFPDARGGLEAWAEEFARVNEIRLKPVPVGFMTWYSEKHGGALNETAVIELSKYLAEKFGDYGYDFVQIDDLWQNGRKRNGPAKDFTRVNPNGPYKGGMKPVTDRIRALGLRPGLWILPFAIDHLDPVFQDRLDWVVKRPDGSPYEVRWSGTALDLTKPEVRAYVAGFIRQAVRDWGFGYLKLDGLHIGMANKQTYPGTKYQEDGFGDAVFADGTKTHMQAGRQGLKTVREAAGPETFILGCCTPQNERSLGMTLGLVDAMRVGPDSNVKWPGVVAGAACSSRLYFLNGRVWWNDPDSIYARAKMPLDEVRCFAGWVALTSTLNNQTDWAPDYPAERVELLRRTMPSHQLKTVRPVDLFENDPARIWVLTWELGGEKRHVVGLFNWGDRAWTARVDRAAAGLDPAAEYDGFEFWGASPVARFGDLEAEVPPRSSRVIAARKVEDRPRLVSTSRHVTQGTVDLVSETWEGGTLKGASRVVRGDPLELRVALRGRTKSWRLKSATVSAGDAGAGVTVSFAQADGWARATLKSPANREVRWELAFEPAD